MTVLKVYGKPDCPQCDTLKQRLDLDEIPYTYLELGNDYSMEQLSEIKPANVRSFPVPFIVTESGTRYIKPEDCTVLDEDIAPMVLDF